MALIILFIYGYCFSQNLYLLFVMFLTIEYFILKKIPKNNLVKFSLSYIVYFFLLAFLDLSNSILFDVVNNWDIKSIDNPMLILRFFLFLLFCYLLLHYRY